MAWATPGGSRDSFSSLIMLLTMVSPHITLNAGTSMSSKISIWSLPTITATSGRASASTCDMRSMACMQRAYRASHTSGVICAARFSDARCRTNSSNVHVRPWK
ncbi:hypothetical protein D9M72_545410 [compost metagenome]